MPYARVNGTMLYYREAGEGRLALFIHGFPLDHTLWLDQLAGLAHVRRCVAVDLRGFGRSDPVVEPTLSMEMLADDVAELIEALGVDSGRHRGAVDGRLRGPGAVGAAAGRGAHPDSGRHPGRRRRPRRPPEAAAHHRPGARPGPRGLAAEVIRSLLAPRAHGAGAGPGSLHGRGHPLRDDRGRPARDARPAGSDPRALHRQRADPGRRGGARPQHPARPDARPGPGDPRGAHRSSCPGPATWRPWSAPPR